MRRVVGDVEYKLIANTFCMLPVAHAFCLNHQLMGGQRKSIRVLLPA